MEDGIVLSNVPHFIANALNQCGIGAGHQEDFRNIFAQHTDRQIHQQQRQKNDHRAIRVKTLKMPKGVAQKEQRYKTEHSPDAEAKIQQPFIGIIAYKLRLGSSRIYHLVNPYGAADGTTDHAEEDDLSRIGRVSPSSQLLYSAEGAIDTDEQEHQGIRAMNERLNMPVTKLEAIVLLGCHQFCPPKV